MTRPGLAAWIAMLALPALAVGARFLLTLDEPDGVARHDRSTESPAIGATWWTAEGDLDEVGRVRARITALHADPARQAFEVRALEARGSPTGLEPYWVQIDFDAGSASARLDPRELRVEDERGVALSAEPIRAPREASDTVDPVVTLLNPPAPLASGQSSSFVLLGRRPAEGARLVRGVGAGLALTESMADAGAGDMPIARIDRRSSEDPARAGEDER